MVSWQLVAGWHSYRPSANPNRSAARDIPAVRERSDTGRSRTGEVPSQACPVVASFVSPC